ncbi:MAG: aconitate hydratase, partial [Atopobiaceae bacterium]|nr:aconitate hydratase [Atopobiaceae bacterium]
HRSNLVQMGVLPLEFMAGEGASALGLVGDESLAVSPVDLSGGLPASRTASVTATRPDGSAVTFDVTVRVDTPMEGEFLRVGGILPCVLGQLDQRDADC